MCLVHMSDPHTCTAPRRTFVHTPSPIAWREERDPLPSTHSSLGLTYPVGTVGPGQLTPLGALENIIISFDNLRENANLIPLRLFLSLQQCNHYSNFTSFKRRPGRHSGPGNSMCMGLATAEPRVALDMWLHSQGWQLLLLLLFYPSFLTFPPIHCFQGETRISQCGCLGW